MVALTIEANAADVLEELLPSSQFHLRTEASVVGTQVPLHVVEGVGHGVHGVNHKLDLPFLFILGIDPNTLLT